MRLNAVIDMNNHAIECLQKKKGSLTESVSLLRLALSVLKQQFAVANGGSPKPNGNIQHEDSRAWRQDQEREDSSSTESTTPRPLNTAAHHVLSEKGPASSASESPQIDGNNWCKTCIDRADVSDSDGGSARRYLSIQSVPVPLNALVASSCSPLHFQDDSFLPLYGRALVVTHCSWEHHEALTAVILFNLALVYHLKGTINGQSPYLQKALVFYKMALGIANHAVTQQQRRGHHQQQEHHHPSVALLPLVVLYNTAQVYAQLFASREMRKYLGPLRQSLAADCESLSSTLCQDDYVFLFMNTMFYCAQGQELAVAPAA